MVLSTLLIYSLRVYLQEHGGDVKAVTDNRTHGKMYKLETSLVVLHIRICLPMQGGHRFNPWSGKIPHASKQLSPPITTTEPACPKAYGAQQEKTLQSERSSRGTTRRSHCLLQLRKAHTQQPRPSTAKNRIFLNFK